MMFVIWLEKFLQESAFKQLQSSMSGVSDATIPYFNSKNKDTQKQSVKKVFLKNPTSDATLAERDK